MRHIIAFYNELEYTICLCTDDGEHQELYCAGNSPYDSQVYVAAEEGIGKEQMRVYAEHTGQNLANENGFPFVGAEYEEIED